MKKFRVLLCIMCLSVFALMAMGSGSSDGDTKDIVSDGGNSGGSDDGNKGEAKVKVTIDEQVLFEQDGIKVTAKEYTVDKIWGDGIKLLIENDSDKNISVGCDALIVNNYMISDLFSDSVAAGKKDNTTLNFSSRELEASGIKNIGKIEVVFRVHDSDNYETLFETDVITIKTSAYDSMSIVAMDAGTTLYEENGIKIVGKKVDENSFWGTAILLYIENNSGKIAHISADDMSINGFMVSSPLLYCDIYDGKMAIDDIAILKSDLESNDIKSVDDVEVSFRIRFGDSYTDVIKTDPIKFSTK